MLHSPTRVKEALRPFVIVSLERNQDYEAFKQLGIENVPMLILYSSSGKEAHRLTGSIPAEQLAGALDKVAFR